MGELPRPEDLPAQLDVLKAEHLAEGVKPIMGCVGTREEFKYDVDKLEDLEQIGHNVEWAASQDKLDKQDFKNAGRETYAISTVDSKPKFTKKLYKCTSLAVVGVDATTGKEISILTHQDPQKFLGEDSELFKDDLEARVGEMKKRCLPGTIDAVIAGGQYDGEKDKSSDYEDSLKMLNGVVKNILGFEAVVIAGPKVLNSDDVYLDTANRRMFVIRPDVKNEDLALFDGGFKPSQTDEMKEKWNKQIKDLDSQK